MEAELTSSFLLSLPGCPVLTGVATVLVWRQRPQAGATELAALSVRLSSGPGPTQSASSHTTKPLDSSSSE